MSGALAASAIAAFGGGSPPVITSDKPSIGGTGYSLSDTATITTIGGRTISSVTLITGNAGGRVTNGGTGSSSTTLTVTTPASGTGFVSGTYRITCSTGEYVDITFTADWGV